MDASSGTLLIAAPALLDPNFRRTVVLLCDHGPESSMGIVINRPTRYAVGTVIPDLEKLKVEGSSLDPRAEEIHRVYCGGPVETSRLLALCHGDHDAESFHEILGHVSLCDIKSAIRNIADDPQLAQNYRFYLGYAGWGQGQLARELEEEAWIVRPASAPLIFDTPTARIWSAALEELGGIYSLYAEMPGDPTVN